MSSDPDGPRTTSSIDEDERPRGLGRLGLVVLLTALLVRAGHVWRFQSAPFADVLLGDSQTYDAWARRIAAGDWIGRGVFYQAPLYPYFLAVIYKLAGTAPLIVRCIQAVIGALSCWLLADAGCRLFSRSAGLAAGLLMAAFGPSLFYEALIQKSILDLFFVCLALRLAVGVQNSPRGSVCWGLGLVLGGLMLTRENGGVFAGVILAWLLLKPRERDPVRNATGGRTRLGLAAFFCAGVAMPLCPVFVRNRLVGGEAHLTTAQLGPNFYIGNNERATGTYQPLRAGRGDARLEQLDATELAEQAAGRELTPGEVSRYWLGQSARYIASQPGHWIRLLGRKALLALNAGEIIDSEDVFTYRDVSPVLRWTLALFHFGVLIPLAVLGLWVTWPQRARLWWLHGLWIAYLGSVVMFYVMGRYRYPLAPMLILLAAAGVVGLRRACFERGTLSIALAAGATLATAVVANWPLLSEPQMRATTLANMAHAVWARGDPDAAIRYAREALRFFPSSVPAMNNLANALATTGRADEAIPLYERVLAVSPDYIDAHNNLGNALATRGRLNEAVDCYHRALAIRPGQASTLNNLGVALIRLGRRAEGKQSILAALRMQPDHVDSLRNLARVLATEGAVDEALAVLLKVAQLKPGDPETELMRTRLLTRRGRSAPAPRTSMPGR